MIWHLNYTIDKDAHTKYFWDNYHRSKVHVHKVTKAVIPTWRKIFDFPEMSDPIIKDLNLEGLNILPRYSYQEKYSRLRMHIDEDEIIGINFNLMPHPVSIHLWGEPYDYEAAIIDVGHEVHSVEPTDYNRLVLKLAIRAPLEEVLDRCKLLLV